MSVKGKWALVLGASSGFGEAISLKLSQVGMNIAGIHMDRKTTLPHAEEVIGKIKSNGVKAMFFNMNAADKDKRKEALTEIQAQAEGGIHTLVHSLAFGSLKPFIATDASGRLSEEQMDMTCNVMAHSLVYWTQDLVERGMLAKGGRIFAMTSSGGTRVWHTYGAVSAAKAALESHCRQLSLELAPYEVAVNAIRAGVTDTPALRKIPGNDKMIEIATERNPYRRLTTPEDIASCVALLVQDGAHWLTGNTLGVDGGEDIVG
jgi:enoyl-[acyl-carrier protein] reductase III